MGVDLERFWPLREAALPGCASDSAEPHPKPQRKSGLRSGSGLLRAWATLQAPHPHPPCGPLSVQQKCFPGETWAWPCHPA